MSWTVLQNETADSQRSVSLVRALEGEEQYNKPIHEGALQTLEEQYIALFRKSKKPAREPEKESEILLQSFREKQHLSANQVSSFLPYNFLIPP